VRLNEQSLRVLRGVIVPVTSPASSISDAYNQGLIGPTVINISFFERCDVAPLSTHPPVSSSPTSLLTISPSPAFSLVRGQTHAGLRTAEHGQLAWRRGCTVDVVDRWWSGGGVFRVQIEDGSGGDAEVESGIEHAKEPLGRALFFSQPSQAETVGHGLGRLSLPKSCQ